MPKTNWIRNLQKKETLLVFIHCPYFLIPIAQSGGVLPPKISPLVEFLNQKKQIKVQKILQREQGRRNKRTPGTTNPTNVAPKEEQVKGTIPSERKVRDDKRKKVEGKDMKDGI